MQINISVQIPKTPPSMTSHIDEHEEEKNKGSREMRELLLLS